MAHPRNSVQTGLWTDHDAHKVRLLTTEYCAAFVASFIAAWLALSWRCIFKILKYLIILVLEKINSNVDNPETERLLEDGNDNRQATTANTIRKILKEAQGGIDLCKIVANYVRSKNNPHKQSSIIVGTLFFGSFIGCIIGGIFSANIVTDSVALWASDHCGIWMFDEPNAGEGAATRRDVRDRNKESRAGEYAKGCYQPLDDSLLQTKDCSFFYKPSIPFFNKTSFECPFPDHGICAPGTPTITFDTGIIDASSLGINHPKIYKFRRSTTCVPLNTGDRFVQSGEDNTFKYYFGEIVDDDRERIRDYTFKTTGNPFDVLAPIYQARAYSTSWYPENDYWVPRPELKPPKDSTLTILAISASHIYYLDSSDDPIFTADKGKQFEGESRPWWFKSDSKWGVLACIDNHQLCSPDGKTCWSMTDEKHGLPPSYWLMKFSLETSNIYDSVARRLGSSLIAQEKVSQFTSVGLRHNHWEFEAERLFATSLARIQFDAWSISNAEGRGEEGFVENTPDEAGDICGLFKFKSAGFKNLDLPSLIVLMLLTPFLWIFHLEVKTVQTGLNWVGNRFRSPSASLRPTPHDQEGNTGNENIHDPHEMGETGRFRSSSASIRPILHDQEGNKGNENIHDPHETGETGRFRSPPASIRPTPRDQEGNAGNENIHGPDEMGETGRFRSPPASIRPTPRDQEGNAGNENIHGPDEMGETGRFRSPPASIRPTPRDQEGNAGNENIRGPDEMEKTGEDKLVFYFIANPLLVLLIWIIRRVKLCRTA